MKSGEVKLFIIILVVAVLLVGVALYPKLTGKGPGAPPLPDKPKEAPANVTRELLIPPWSHIRGNPKAPYSLVVFADFQCPSCKSSVEATKELLKTYKDRLNVVFHHYHVSLQHFNAPLMGQAAEAAAAQGKFWEMHDALFERQHQFSTQYEVATITGLLAEVAGEIRLDVLKFREAITNGSAKKAYDRDFAIGEKIRIKGTPTYYFVPPKGKPVVLSTTTQMMEWVQNPKNWKP